jgi:hypothetical protein
VNTSTIPSRPSPSAVTSVAPPTRRWWSRSTRTAVLAAVAALTITASALTATPAHAEGVDAASVEHVLRGAGVVGDVTPDRTKAVQPNASTDAAADAAMRAPVAAASVSLKSGLSVPSGTGTVGITPVVEPGGQRSGAAKALSPSGLAVYANTADSSFAFSKASAGANAGYAVITGADAPTAYRFAFTVDGKPAVLRLVAGGGVDVLDANGTLVNSIAPAWAKDATGAALPSSYSVSGNVLTQSVTHAGAAYPVIADPRVRCDSLWCTLELTRAETRGVAANVLSLGGPCALMGGGAPVCVTVLAGGWAMANLALGQGKCIGYRVWKANFVSFAQLAYVGCYA